MIGDNAIDKKPQIPYNTRIYSLIMDYKPYSMEWSRRRYLAEAIQKYFDTDAPVDVILDDIVDVLGQNVAEHQSRAEKFQEVLNGLKSL